VIRADLVHPPTPPFVECEIVELTLMGFLPVCFRKGLRSLHLDAAGIVIGVDIDYPSTAFAHQDCALEVDHPLCLITIASNGKMFSSYPQPSRKGAEDLSPALLDSVRWSHLPGKGIDCLPGGRLPRRDFAPPRSGFFHSQGSDHNRVLVKARGGASVFQAVLQNDQSR